MSHLVEEVQSLAVERDDDVVGVGVHLLWELVLADVEEAGAVEGVVAHGGDVVGLQLLGLGLQQGGAVGQHLLGPGLRVEGEGKERLKG